VMPSMSVVIPCRNDAVSLHACLAALAGQTTAPLEVLVVDNASTDSSKEVAQRWKAYVVSEPHVGIPAAAAAGYDAARGNIIVRCDADSLPPPDWLERIGRRFGTESNVAALTGPAWFYPEPNGRLPPWSRLYLPSYFLAMGAAMARRPLFGSNLAFRRDVWLRLRCEVHRDDPELHDDVCLSFHLQPEHRVAYDKDLSVGISARALHGRSNLRRRFRRAFHTLAVHWRQGPPWQRWRVRLVRAAQPWRSL
jgi:glycosyltransferase involved in cell wall biosynthesis